MNHRDETGSQSTPAERPADRPTGGGHGESREPEAIVQRTPWRGWIWAVPLAAVMLVAYLAVRTWVLAGPTVTVVFPDAGGIGPEGTPVKHRGVQIGYVEDVRLTDELDEVVVRVSIDRVAADYLRAGARFWIVRPGLGGRGGVKGMLAGPYIEMAPGEGERRDRFDGHMWRPIEGAVEFVFTPPTPADGLEAGAAVRLGGRLVGRVRAVGLEVDAGSGTVATPVRIALDPTKLGLASGDAAETRSLMSKLVNRGLRAQVRSTRLVLGEEAVALVMADAPPSAQADLDAEPPRLPAMAAADLQTVLARVDKLVAAPTDQPDAEKLVAELIETAKSARELIDYLTQHPEAIIRGRTD